MQPNKSRFLEQLALGFFLDNKSWLIPASLFFISFVIMLIIGNPMIEWLRHKQWKKGKTVDETWAVREDTPDTHQVKKGTPSMGGIGIISATLLSYAAMTSCALITIAVLSKQSLPTVVEILAFLLLPLVFLAHGLLGFADDWSKASGRGGLRARTKLAGQIVLALIFVGLVLLLAQSLIPNNPNFLFSQTSAVSGLMLLLACGFLAFVVIATSNAVNLTDGIDGLAAGLAVQCGLVLLLVGDSNHGIPGIASVSMWTWVALAGACLGFLRFNRYKARVFMGDTGSLAIGAALGAGAILQGAVSLLPFIGFIYFVEMFSVIAQVMWFKWTKRQTGEGKRLFRRAPLHHHFEMSGWSEWRVVGTFWAVNLVTSAIGLWLWHAGVLPRWP